MPHAYASGGKSVAEKATSAYCVPASTATGGNVTEVNPPGYADTFEAGTLASASSLVSTVIPGNGLATSQIWTVIGCVGVPNFPR